jgi:hypothetical protein
LFEIIPFPDEFWNESREWRYQIRDNWRGAGKPLNDFWANFKYLCDRYHAQRYLDELKAKKQAFCWSCLVPGFQAKPPGCEY